MYVVYHVEPKVCSLVISSLFDSDDRSADVFRQKLEATTQMQPVLTPDCRPTCLIIDEIDGAPTVSV